ncbi:MAG: patatin-like phospholipase family protein [Steroidobacteraceae bacterium]|nr:patatin-like phospholipase family protein [Steroidobacteraceae bacterium]
MHSAKENRTPPRLALVLGSGGVRSIAALGIVDVLDDVGLKPDLVVGCSSGALFGACVAAGWAAGQGLDAALKLWSPELTQKKRWRAYVELVAPKLIGFGADFALRDAGLIRARVERAFGDMRIEDLAVPLRIVATDATRGGPVVLTRGRVADAVRASMALPFMFPSVEIDGRRLTDGVLTDPLPVSVANDARALLTVGFRGAMPRRVDRASRLVAQVTTTMINNLQDARLAAARAAGQRMLNFELDIDRRIGLWETAAMPRIFEIGQRAAREQLPAIRRMLELPLAA